MSSLQAGYSSPISACRRSEDISFNAYDPLLDPQGNLIGILYVGIPIDEITAMADRLSQSVILNLFAVFAALKILSRIPAVIRKRVIMARLSLQRIAGELMDVHKNHSIDIWNIMHETVE